MVVLYLWERREVHKALYLRQGTNGGWCGPRPYQAVAGLTKGGGFGEGVVGAKSAPLSDGDAVKKLGVQQGNGGRGDLQFPSHRLVGH